MRRGIKERIILPFLMPQTRQRPMMTPRCRSMKRNGPPPPKRGENEFTIFINGLRSNPAPRILCRAIADIQTHLAANPLLGAVLPPHVGRLRGILPSLTNIFILIFSFRPNRKCRS